jgi:hypothetical protein
MKIKCPACQQEYDIVNPVRVGEGFKRAESMGTPDKGDYTSCYHCLATLRWDGEVWHEVTEMEWVELPVEKRSTLRAAQETILKTRARGIGISTRAGLDAKEEEEAKKLISLVPWFVLEDMMEKRPPEAVMYAMGRGLGEATRAIAERPDSKTEDDLRLSVPIVFAQAFLACEGDYAKAKKMLVDYLNDRIQSEGLDRSKVGVVHRGQHRD